MEIPGFSGALVGTPRGSGFSRGDPGGSHGGPGITRSLLWSWSGSYESPSLPGALQGPCLGVWSLRLVLVVPGCGPLGSPWPVPTPVQPAKAIGLEQGGLPVQSPDSCTSHGWALGVWGLLMG